MEQNVTFYKDLLNYGTLNKNSVLIAKYGNSYLVGPLINDNFDKQSFIKRIKSNCIFDYKKYKKIRKSVYSKLIKKYISYLADNEVIEIHGDKFHKYKILKVPGDNYV